MRDVVYHHTEASQCPHAKQCHVARFSKHHFIVGFIAFGAEDGVADLSLDLLLSGGGKNALPARCDTDALQNVRRKPNEF